MSANAEHLEPGPTVRVWDPLVRLFHWSLVLAFAASFATGDDATSIHIRLGWLLAGLIGLRLVWGLVGPRHARFTDFIYRPSTVMAHLRDMLAGSPTRYLGHNPAGGAMVIAMLIMLTIICATGYMLTLDAWFGAEWVEGLHEAAAFIMLAMVALHILGVIAASLEHRENLVLSMITGRKRRNK